MLNGSLWCGLPSTSRISAARSLSIRQYGLPSRKNRHALPVPNHWNVKAAWFLPYRMKNLPLVVTFRKWRRIFFYYSFNLSWKKDVCWSSWSYFCVFFSSSSVMPVAIKQSLVIVYVGSISSVNPLIHIWNRNLYGNKKWSYAHLL